MDTTTFQIIVITLLIAMPIVVGCALSLHLSHVYSQVTWLIEDNHNRLSHTLSDVAIEAKAHTHLLYQLGKPRVVQPMTHIQKLTKVDKPVEVPTDQLVGYFGD